MCACVRVLHCAGSLSAVSERPGTTDTCRRYDGIACSAVLSTRLVQIPSDAYQIDVEQRLIRESYTAAASRAVVTIFQFDGRSTAYQRSLRSQ